MIVRTEPKQGIPLTANARKIMDLRYGAKQTETVFRLDAEDMRSLNGCDHPYYNYLFDIILNALRLHKIQSFTQIELTEHAAGMTFAGLNELEKYLLKDIFPEGIKIFIKVDDNTHPMVREKALRLQRMFSHSDPCKRVIDYMKNPQSDTTMYITEGVLYRYELSTGSSLMKDLCEVIASGKLAPRTKIIFEGNTIVDEAQARQLSECILNSKPAAGFHVYIPTTSNDKKDVSVYQDKIWNFLEARKNGDKAAAMAVFLSGGYFSYRSSDGIKIDRGIAGKIYGYLNDALADSYKQVAALQSERVNERIQARKRWNFFKAVAVTAGGFALAVGATALMKNSK